VLPLPLLVAWFLPRAPEMQGTALRVPFYAALSRIAAGRQAPASRRRLLLAVLAWVLLVCAAARPQFAGPPVRLLVTGRDLLLAVDISGSMETEDMQLGERVTDRLTAVKAVAGAFIEQRQGDRLGLILFGDQAYLQTPLTFDRETVRTLLNEAAIGLAGKSTAIGDAIGLAVKRLRERPAENRVLILLTDGANTSGSVDPLKAADLAAREGVRIYSGRSGHRRCSAPRRRVSWCWTCRVPWWRPTSSPRAWSAPATRSRTCSGAAGRDRSA
jgi:Ca-activated chloride channel family protein